MPVNTVPDLMATGLPALTAEQIEKAIIDTVAVEIVEILEEAPVATSNIDATLVGIDEDGVLSNFPLASEANAEAGTGVGWMDPQRTRVAIQTLVSRPEDAPFNAVGNGVANDTTALNAWAAHLVDTGIPGLALGQYKISGSFAPNGKTIITWAVGSEIIADTTSTAFNAILENPSGGTMVPSGKLAITDWSNCAGSRNYGVMTVIGASPGGAITLSARAGIPVNLVAMGVATGDAAEIQWDSVFVRGTGYIFFQGDMRGTVVDVPRMVRWRISQLEGRSCLVPWETGQSGNGFDDSWIGTLTLSKCGGRALLRGSDLRIDEFYNNGLRFTTDAESQTLACTADVADATLSGSNSLIVVGTVLAIEDGGLGKGGQTIPHVAQVTAKVGNVVTLEPAPEQSGSFAIIGNPPSIYNEVATLYVGHYYPEYIHDFPMRQNNGGSFRCDDLKVSAGECSARLGAIVLTTGLRSIADVKLNFKSTEADTYKTLVGFGMVSNGGTDPEDLAATFVRVQVPVQRAEATADKAMFMALELPDTLLGTLTSIPLEPVMPINVTLDYIDVKVSQQNAGMVHAEGDSFVAGSDGVFLGTILRDFMDRDLRNTAVGGSSPEDISDRLVAASANLKGKTLFIWDGDPNAMITATENVDDLAVGIDAVGHRRIIVIPPCYAYEQVDTSLEDDIAAEELLRWPNYYLDWRDYLEMSGGAPTAAMYADLPGDTTHLSQAAMELMAPAIAAKIREREQAVLLLGP